MKSNGKRRNLGRLTGLLALIGLVTVAIAQPKGPPTIDWTAKGLSPTAIELPSIGLSIHLPLDAILVRQEMERRKLIIQEPGKAWIATVDVQQTTDERLTMTIVRRQIAAEVAVSNPGVIFPVDRSMEIMGIEMYQFEAVLPRTDQSPKARRIYTIMKPLADTFVIHTFWCPEADIKKYKKLNQNSVESIRFVAPQDLNVATRGALYRVDDLFGALTESDYRRLAIRDQWYRVYQPTERGGGVREVAFFRFEEKIAPRGAVNPERNPRDYSVMESTKGFLVRQTARYLFPQKDNVTGAIIPDALIAEIEGISWVSFDRSHEVWSIRSVTYTRTGREKYKLSERSALTGNRRHAKIDVQIEMGNSQRKMQTFTRPPRGYVSVAEQRLLYRLFDLTVPIEYKLYTYVPDQNQIRLRSEKIQPSEANGRITSTSRRSPDAEPNMITLDANGNVQRMVQPNGVVTVPSSLKEIHKLWKAAGLPTGKLTK